MAGEASADEDEEVDQWDGGVLVGASQGQQESESGGDGDDGTASEYYDSDAASINTTASASVLRREKPSLVPNESNYTFNPIEYMVETLNGALDSLEYDQSLVVQSKMAGELNNSSNEVLKTISELKAAIHEHIAKYELLQKQIIPDIDRNLRKASQQIKQLTALSKAKYPVEYARARAKVLDNVNSDEEGVYL